MTKQSASRGLLACFAVACGAAGATTVSLGEVVAPLSWPIYQPAPVGSLLDRFTFAIAADEPLVFSLFVRTGPSRRASILDFRGELFRDGELLDTGDSETTFLPGGYPDRSVSFDPLLLDRGDYEIRFSGTVYSVLPSQPIGSGYAGSAEFKPAPAIPEPPALWLVALGITALLRSGWAKRRPAGLGAPDPSHPPRAGATGARPADHRGGVDQVAGRRVAPIESLRQRELATDRAVCASTGVQGGASRRHGGRTQPPLAP